jgi:hypothetical protein
LDYSWRKLSLFGLSGFRRGHRYGTSSLKVPAGVRNPGQTGQSFSLTLPKGGCWLIEAEMIGYDKKLFGLVGWG